jgi:phenylacetic acid degradation operon negative regulatory protein
VSQEINHFIANRTVVANISCKTFLVTIFGDVVSQHGNWIWLGSLVKALEPLGYSERLVRTSVNRLLKEDWLQMKSSGRKSYYSFTAKAQGHYTKAARRIYANDSTSNKDQWLIIFTSFVNDKLLPELKKQLHWLGFSSLTSGVYAHPGCSIKSLHETIQELNLSDAVVIFDSQIHNNSSLKVLKQLVFEKWQLDQLQQKYLNLITNYKPFIETIKFNPQQCFMMRVLLIHEYRRILLSDHELTDEMLPDNWQGHAARKMVKSLYSKINSGSLQYINNNLENLNGFLEAPNIDFSKRFVSAN